MNFEKEFNLDELASVFWREPKQLKDFKPEIAADGLRPVLSPISKAVSKLDIREVARAAWQEKGSTAEFNDRNQLIVDGQLCATFVNREGKNFISNGGSSDYPAQGNAVTYAAGVLGVDYKEAFKWLIKRFGLEEVKKTNLPGEIVEPEFPEPKSAKELMETKFPDTIWAIENLFTDGTINQISAAPNQWKSWLTQYFAYKIAKGEPVFNRFKTKQMGVLMVNEEDPARTSKNRLSMLTNGQVEDIPVYFYNDQGFQLEENKVRFLIGIMKKKNLEMVIFDSLSVIHEANENSATEMNSVFRIMRLFIREGITVLFTNHHRKKPTMKGQADAGQEQTRGSSVINAQPAGHITCEPFDVGTDKYITISQMKLKEEEKIKPFVVKIIMSEDRKAIDFVYEENGKLAQSTNIAEKAAEEIINILMNSSVPLSKGQIFDMKPAGAGRIALDEAMKSLKQRDLISYKTRKELGMPMPFGTAASEKFYFIDKESSEKLPF